MISVSGDVSMCEGDREREGEVRESMRARVRVEVGAGGEVSIWILCHTLEGARVGVGVRIRVETHPRKMIL